MARLHAPLIFSLGLCACGADPSQGLGPAPRVDRDDGRAAPVGSGRVFVVSDLKLMGPACQPGADCGTVLALGGSGFGELINDQLRQGLLGGEALQLLELTGLDEPDGDTDTRMEVRVYPALDADEPFYPGNNFQILDRETTCCEYEIAPGALDPGDRPRDVLRGQLDRGALEVSAPQGAVVGFGLFPSASSEQTEGRPASNLRLTRVGLVGRLGPRGDGQRGLRPEMLTELKIEGGWPVQELAALRNPYCRTASPQCTGGAAQPWLLNLILLFGQPDLDVDGDGLERLEADQNGAIVRCRDGSGALVPALESGLPESCALDPRMADAYAVSLALEAVSAKIVGIRR